MKVYYPVFKKMNTVKPPKKTGDFTYFKYTPDEALQGGAEEYVNRDLIIDITKEELISDMFRIQVDLTIGTNPSYMRDAFYLFTIAFIDANGVVEKKEVFTEAQATRNTDVNARNTSSTSNLNPSHITTYNIDLSKDILLETTTKIEVELWGKSGTNSKSSNVTNRCYVSIYDLVEEEVEIAPPQVNGGNTETLIGGLINNV